MDYDTTCCILKAAKTPNNVIRCATYEEAENFLGVLDAAGIVWNDGRPALFHLYKWKDYESETCFNLSNSGGKITFTESDYFIRHHYNVIDFSSLVEPSISLLDLLG